MIKLFWLCLSMACLGWYLVILWYVAVKGAIDIRHMLTRLTTEQKDESRGPIDPS